MVPIKSTHLKAVLGGFRSIVLIAAIEVGIIILLVALGNSGLLDITTIISVVVPEIGIGIFLFYLLGESRRSRVDEVINLIEASEKFSHLKVHTFSIFPRPFSYTFYFLENKSVNQYFEAPDYIVDMVKRRLIVVKAYKNEAEMRKSLGSVFQNDRKPCPTELKVGG